jgi:hypothetical protein
VPVGWVAKSLSLLACSWTIRRKILEVVTYRQNIERKGLALELVHRKERGHGDDKERGHGDEETSTTRTQDQLTFFSYGANGEVKSMEFCVAPPEFFP